MFAVRLATVPGAKRARRPHPLIGSIRFCKLCFTIGVGCHMIVKLVASSPAYFPSGNGKVGIMDSDLWHLLPELRHNWVAYAVGAAAVVAILAKQQVAAC